MWLSVWKRYIITVWMWPVWWFHYRLYFWNKFLKSQLFQISLNNFTTTKRTTFSKTCSYSIKCDILKNFFFHKRREGISAKHQRTRLMFAWWLIIILRVILSRPTLPVHCPCCQHRLGASQKQWTHFNTHVIFGREWRENGVGSRHSTMSLFICCYSRSFSVSQQRGVAVSCVLCQCGSTTTQQSELVTSHRKTFHDIL